VILADADASARTTNARTAKTAHRRLLITDLLPKEALARFSTPFLLALSLSESCHSFLKIQRKYG
jgi:hypothetical protein